MRLQLEVPKQIALKSMGKGRLANGRRSVRDRGRERRQRQLKRELLSERPKEAPYTAADVRADAAKELPLSFTLPWLALNGLGCYIFPTSGFSSVICNASYLVYLSL